MRFVYRIRHILGVLTGAIGYVSMIESAEIYQTNPTLAKVLFGVILVSLMAVTALVISAIAEESYF